LHGDIDPNANNDQAKTRPMKPDGLTLRDHTAKLFALARMVAIIEAFDDGRSEELEAMLGADASAIVDRMRRTTLSEAVALSEMKQLRMWLAIDPCSLKSCFHTLDVLREEQKMFEYFVQHQASPALLAEPFKRPPHQIKAYRKFLGAHVRGRPKLPDDKVRDAICESWDRLSRSIDDPRERYYKLHRELPDCNFLQLEAVIASYESTV
jgi:hypothetical protein